MQKWFVLQESQMLPCVDTRYHSTSLSSDTLRNSSVEYPIFFCSGYFYFLRNMIIFFKYTQAAVIAFSWRDDTVSNWRINHG